MVDQRPQIRNPLFATDIFYTILDNFYPEFDPTEKQALVALALTCRALSEYSLDRLWRNLSSLEPLIRCYTSDIENPNPPTTSRFAIIDRYSHRVRELTVSGSASVRYLKCLTTRPSCLFPNLMILKWNPYRPRRVNIPTVFIQQLLSPTLISLQVDLSDSDGAALLSFFDHYPLLCRNLKSLGLGFLLESPHDTTIHTTTIRALSRAICRQSALENVTLRAPIDDVALTHLITLPTLTMLSLKLTEGSRPHTLPDSIFRNVEKLKVDTSDLDLAASLLRPPEQIYHTLEVIHPTRVTPGPVLALLNVLMSRPRRDLLRKLTLATRNTTHPPLAESEVPHYRLSYTTLQPLMAFGSLRSLMIEWSEQISLDDDELESLVRSWPLLEVFIFTCGRNLCPPMPPKCLTLRGLLSLAAACTKLETVTLFLDATQVPEAEAEPVETNFTWLTVDGSPVGKALLVADFLFRYLPCVTTVDNMAIAARTSAYDGEWRKVQKCLERLHGYEYESEEIWTGGESGSEYESSSEDDD